MLCEKSKEHGGRGKVSCFKYDGFLLVVSKKKRPKISKNYFSPRRRILFCSEKNGARMDKC